MTTPRDSELSATPDDGPRESPRSERFDRKDAPAPDDVETPAERAKRHEATWEIVVVVLAFVVPYALYPLVGEPAPRDTKSMLWGIVADAGTVGVLLYLLARSGVEWQRFGFAPMRAGEDLLCGACLFAFFWYVPPLVAASLGFATPGTPESIWRPDGIGLWTLTGASIVLGAFLEELLFRAHLLQRFEQAGCSVAQAVFLSALLFGAVHTYQGATGVCTSIVFGLGAGLVVAVTQRLWPAVAAHAAFNVLVYARYGVDAIQ